MRTLILGGTGFIGTALTQSLIKDHHEVIILSRNPTRIQNRQPGVTVESWDSTTATGWGHLVNTVDAVINLVGEGIADGRWTENRKRRINQSRINAGRAVMQALESASTLPRVLVQASAVGYYGNVEEGLLTEADPPQDDFMSQVCIDWEASTGAAEALGVRRVVIRTGVVLDRTQGAFPKLALPFAFFAGGPLGNGNQWFPWIHIVDQVAAIRFLLENKTASGAFNLTAPGLLTNARFGKILGRVMRRPSLLPVPAIALRLMFGEMADALLHGQPATPHRLTELGFNFQFPQAEAALKDLLS